jgi:hypothetical protein
MNLIFCFKEKTKKLPLKRADEMWDMNYEPHMKVTHVCGLGCFEFLAPLLQGHFGGWMSCSPLLYWIVFLKYIKIFIFILDINTLKLLKIINIIFFLYQMYF